VEEFTTQMNGLNELVFNYVVALIRNVEAIHVSIYFDGIPPVPKIHQQRIRRICTTRVYYRDNVVYTSASIMPGSVLTMSLQQFIEEKMQKVDIPSVINGFGIPGEGEHKIAEDLRGLGNSHRGTIVVAGRDNDFCLLLGLISTAQTNMDIVYAVLNIERDDITFVSIRRQITNMLRRYKMETSSNPEEIRKAYINLVVIITICYGNDFLPPVEFIHHIGIEIFDTVLIKICENYRAFTTSSVRQEISAIYSSVGRVCTDSEMTAYLDSGLDRQTLYESITAKIGAPTLVKKPVSVFPDHNNLVDMSTMDINVEAMKLFFTKLSMVSNDCLLLQSNSTINDYGLQRYVNKNVMQFYRNTKSPKPAVEDYITVLQWILKYYSPSYRSVVDCDVCYQCPYAPSAGSIIEGLGVVEIDLTKKIELTPQVYPMVVLSANDMEIPSEYVFTITREFILHTSRYLAYCFPLKCLETPEQVRYIPHYSMTELINQAKQTYRYYTERGGTRPIPLSRNKTIHSVPLVRTRTYTTVSTIPIVRRRTGENYSE
jgi:hypothetical protein